MNPTSFPKTPEELNIERLRVAQELARRSPANLAEYLSEGRWKRFPHLAMLNEKLLIAAKRGKSRLMVMMPPQHGKSTMTSLYFPAWFLGINPNKRVILASYETDYAEQWGRKVRDVLEHNGQSVFGVEVSQGSSAAGRWDIARVNGKNIPPDYQGGMNATGVGGPITGKKGDLVLIDDPVKDDEQAQSEIDREKKYAWYLTVAFTRLSENGIVILVQTRWHEDDLAGRLLRDMEQGTGEKFEVIRLPGIAEEDENWGTWRRKKGEPLCPELFTLDTLQKRQSAMGDHRWARLYQQRPYPQGGGMFDVRKLRERIIQSNREPRIEIRGWDLAATEKKDSKRTAGVKLAKNLDGRYVVEHVVLGKWTPDKRNAIMKATAEEDEGIKILFEHEGGSSGEDQALSIARLLQGHRVEGVKVTGDKVTRADAVAAQVNLGNVWIVNDGTWDVESFLAELEGFPNGTYKDQVDALSLSFNAIWRRTVDNQPEALTAGHQSSVRREDLPPPDDDRPATPWDGIRPASPFERRG